MQLGERPLDATLGAGARRRGGRGGGDGDEDLLGAVAARGREAVGHLADDCGEARVREHAAQLGQASQERDVADAAGEAGPVARELGRRDLRPPSVSTFRRL